MRNHAQTQQLSAADTAIDTARPGPEAAATATAPEGGGGSGAAAARHRPPDSLADNFEQRGFQVVEADLPARLGISRELIRVLREQVLEKGRHWIKAHRDILLTEEAVEILLKGHAALKNAAPLPAQPSAPKVAHIETVTQAEPVKNPPVELRVKRTYPWNRLQLEAHFPDQPTWIVHVRVASSANYAPGMRIYARHISAKFYEIHGRAPRWRGETLYRDSDA